MHEPYVPLFCSITRSTVWAEDAEVCKVFITMMAMADFDGYVAGAATGIAAVASLPVETVDRALAVLMAPDPRSRNKANGGRRVVEVDRGWHMPAIPWFRQLARLEAEKARKRQWARANNSGRPKGASASARRTETETETEIQTKTETERDLGSEGSAEGSAPAAPAPAAVAAPKAKRAPKLKSWKQVPEDWPGPNDSHRAQAEEWGWDEGRLELQAKAYRLHDYRVAKKDPDRTFAAWMVLSEERNPGRASGAITAQQTLKYKFDPDWKPGKDHRAKGQELGLTDAEIIARKKDCLLKPIKQGFVSEDEHFMRELVWAARDKETQRKKEEAYVNRKAFETPGADRT
jgi:hypothetical protein